MDRALPPRGGYVGTGSCAARPAASGGDPQWGGSGALHTRDRAALATIAVHRFVSPLPQHRRVPLFHRTGLAGTPRTPAGDSTDDGGRARSVDLLARAYGIAIDPHRRPRPVARVRRRRPAALCRD